MVDRISQEREGSSALQDIDTVGERVRSAEDKVTLAIGQVMLAGSGGLLVATEATGNPKYAYVSAFSAVVGLAITSLGVNNKSST